MDFEKAFDTVSWKFFEKVLDYFNFGPSVKLWIKLFQNGSESCIIQNGHMSDFLQLKRGCRQGDPLSPYIFILCAEILGKLISKNQTLKGIIINGKEFRLSQYADDTQIFLDGTEKSLKETLSILNLYYNMSGLKINIETRIDVYETLCPQQMLVHKGGKIKNWGGECRDVTPKKSLSQNIRVDVNREVKF